MEFALVFVALAAVTFLVLLGIQAARREATEDTLEKALLLLAKCQCSAGEGLPPPTLPPRRRLRTSMWLHRLVFRKRVPSEPKKHPPASRRTSA